MKRIRIVINGASFVIDECEGRAEIRFEHAPKIDAGPEIEALFNRRIGYDRWIDMGGRVFALPIKVEKLE